MNKNLTNERNTGTAGVTTLSQKCHYFNRE